MKLSSLLDFIHAAHHTWLVESEWEERGGILLIASPGQLKTTIINTLETYSEARCLGDINIRSMRSLRDMILGGRYRTIGFGEFEKLYARNPATAVNIEGHLKQIVEEGLRHFSHEDQANAIMPSRALIIAGLTPGMYGKMSTPWRESGFLRRFLRIQYTLRDERILLEAIHRWKKISIDLPTTWNGRIAIKYNLEDSESRWLLSLLKEQQDSTPCVLLKKIAVVLKKRDNKNWHSIIEDVAPSFGDKGILVL